MSASLQSQAPRRRFLADIGLGFAGLAGGSMLAGPQTHFRPRAKSVIWIFLSGGFSQMETFDPKPALNKYAGKTFQETPIPDPLKSPLHDTRSRSVILKVRDKYTKIFPLQTGFKKHGQSGIEISDWWPNLAQHVDDLTFVRNMWTTDNDHAAENQFHTGRHKLDEVQPSVGAWATYGLGTLNENLPEFVVLGGPSRTDTKQSIDSTYLGPQHAGVPLALGSATPLPYAARQKNLTAQQQRNEFDLIGRLNRLAAADNPRDQQLLARIRSYELAYRMQTAVPEALGYTAESESTRKLYGIDHDITKTAGSRLLTARRLVERGVRFVQIYPGNYGAWDSHKAIKVKHSAECEKTDKPVAGLIADLKSRGMLDDTIVVFCTEFGRTPAVEERSGGTDGRDHHPHGFTIWMAGAGLKKGYVHGETDELGFHASDPGHYVTDIHATVLHLLGVDNRRLEVPGRKRLEIDHGEVIDDILA